MYGSKVLRELTFWWDLLFGVLRYGNAQTLPRKQSHNRRLSGSSADTHILTSCFIAPSRCINALQLKQRTMQTPDIVTKPPLPIPARHSWSSQLSTGTIWTEPCVETVPLPDFSLPPRNPEFSHQPPLPSYTLVCLQSSQHTRNKPHLWSSSAAPDRYFLPIPLLQGVYFLWSPTLHSCLKGVRALSQVFSARVEPIDSTIKTPRTSPATQ